MTVADVKKVIEKNYPRQIGAIVENLLKTGRLVTQTGLDLQQVQILGFFFIVAGIYILYIYIL